MSYAEYYRSPEDHLNILWLDDDPSVAAQQHCDRHVPKMIMETAQILSSVWHVQAGVHAGAAWTQVLSVDWLPPTQAAPPREIDWFSVTLCGQRIYRARHTIHPAVAWACQYGGNYDWLYKLGMALLAEYEYRFGRLHACMPVLRTLELMPPPLLKTADQFCDGRIIMPAEIAAEEVVESYRNYYRKSKLNSLQYTRRKPPTWIAERAFYKGE